MSLDKYHHGALKEELIKKGIKLLNEGGSKNFSMRKLASLCNVSHAAPYKHFKNKEEIISEIMQYVLKELAESLKKIQDKSPTDNPEFLITELGKQYVKFMVDNPDYLKILFLSDFETKIIIDNGNINSEYEAFNILKNNAIKAFKLQGIEEKYYARNIVAMWSMVHGIAIMIVNKTVVYGGDLETFAGDILRNNMKF